MDEILATLIEGLALQNQRLTEISEDLTSTQKELGDFEGEYSKEIKVIHDRIDAINVQIYSTIKQEISKIEFPKPKEVQQLTINDIKSLIGPEIKKLSEKRDLEVSKIRDEVLEIVYAIEIPSGPRGPKGDNATTQQVESAVLSWTKENKDDLIGPLGPVGPRGLNGKSGIDGISIIDVTIKKDVMTIHFSDGETKDIKLPKQKVMMGGGGISNEALQDATNELIISTNIDLELTAKNQTVLVDATSGDINITLPKPTNCFIRGRSNKIAITKIDNSDNTVNIIPYDSELVLSENSQELLQRHEILNFITDSTNWYLGA